MDYNGAIAPLSCNKVAALTADDRVYSIFIDDGTSKIAVLVVRGSPQTTSDINQTVNC